MPKVQLTLQAAKERESDILNKLGKVQRASKNHKTQTKQNQLKTDWAEHAKKNAADSKRYENDLRDAALEVAKLIDDNSVLDEEVDLTPMADAWFQVSGVRKLLGKLRPRDPQRLRQAPDQASSLHDVLGSVSVAIRALGADLAAEVAWSEDECKAARRSLNAEFSHSALPWAAGASKHGACEHCADLSDQEDRLITRCEDDTVEYGDQLQLLNDRFNTELAALEQEIANQRRRLATWDDDAHFRFVCIKKQLQGKGRDLLVDRLSLEFPHLSREQLQAHEAHVDSLKYSLQKQSAAFRQWRHDRLQLFRRFEPAVDAKSRESELAEVRKAEAMEQRSRQSQLHRKLESDRERYAVFCEQKIRAVEEQLSKVQAAEAERDDAFRRRAKIAKDVAQQYMEKKADRKTQLDEEREEKTRIEAEERYGRMQRNAKAVRLRRQMDELKLRDVSQQRQAVEQEQREREERLQQALARLRIEAPRDPKRLLKLPSSASADAYNDPLVCVTRGPACGFYERTLMSDARYKLSAALHAAGLAGTAAAHEALNRVAAPRPAHHHTFSEAFGGGYPD